MQASEQKHHNDTQPSKVGKRILLVLQLVVLAIIVFLLFLFLFPINLERYKSTISTAVLSATGREFTIRGDVTMKLGINPTVTMEDVSLANAPWSRRERMLQVDSMRVDLSLWPLLGREVEIQDITIRGTTITLSTNQKNGKGNWVFSPAKTAPERAPSADEPAFRFNSIDRIRLLDSTIQYWPDETGDMTVLHLDSIAIDNPDMTHLTAQLDKTGGVNDFSFLKAVIVKDGRLTLPASSQSNDEHINIKRAEATPGKDSTPLEISIDYEGHPYTLEATLSPKDAGYRSDIASLTTPYGAFSGTVSVADAQSAPLSITADLKSERLSTPTSTPDSGGPDWRDQPVPSKEWLPFSLNLTLNTQKLVIGERELSAVELSAISHKGLLTIDRFSTALAGGSATISGTYDIAASSAKLEMDAIFKDIFIDDLKAFIGGESSALHEGAFSTELFIDSTGRTFRKLLTNASIGGPFYGEGMHYPISEISSKKLVQALAGDSNADSIKISCIAADLYYKKSVLRSDKYAFVTQGAITAGSGEYNFDKDRIDMVIHPKSKVIGFSDLVVTPFKISGPINDLSVYPDPKGVLKNAGLTALSTATGVGVIGIIGLKVLDKLDTAVSGGPCKEVTSPEDIEDEAEPPEGAKSAEPVPAESNENAAPLPDAEASASAGSGPKNDADAGTTENLMEGQPENLGEAIKPVSPAPAESPTEATKPADDKPAEKKPAAESSEDSTPPASAPAKTPERTYPPSVAEQYFLPNAPQADDTTDQQGTPAVTSEDRKAPPAQPTPAPAAPASP